MNTQFLLYAGAPLRVSSLLIDNDLWPTDMQLRDWPSFCGAGEGLGDYIVPDNIFGVNISPACFQHDIEYSVNDRNWLAFMAANWRLRQNIIALTDAHLTCAEREAAHVIADDYYVAVMAFGWLNFKPDATEENWRQSEIVKSKLHRLATHNLCFSEELKCHG